MTPCLDGLGIRQTGAIRQIDSIPVRRLLLRRVGGNRTPLDNVSSDPSGPASLVRIWTPAIPRLARLCLTLSVVVLFAGPSAAKLCGNDVQGRAVPCACGDTVVSDVVLADDPVGHTVCSGDGLIVRAAQAKRGVTIDLHGRSLRGTGNGTGIWIVNGGPGGARLLSRGQAARITGFRDGVVARGGNSVAWIEGILAAGNARDGVRVQAPGYTIRGVEAQDSGRDGFSLGGVGFRVTDSRALRSGRFGYFVMGNTGALGASGEGDSALGSGHAAFSVTGVGHHVIDCHASGAAQEGVHLNGMHFVLSGCVAQDNGGDGISGTGGDILLSGNQAIGNGNSGINVHGVHVVDGGGNRGTGNLGGLQQRSPLQCQIGGVPCAR